MPSQETFAVFLTPRGCDLKVRGRQRSGPALMAPGSSGISEGHVAVIPSPDAVPDPVKDPVGALHLSEATPRGSPKPAIRAAGHLDASPENPGLGQTSTTGVMVARDILARTVPRAFHPSPDPSDAFRTTRETAVSEDEEKGGPRVAGPTAKARDVVNDTT
ncbi:hypothetical protein MG293_018598 [Ovis ammon polii]|uniref:Uncharacterized protein n=1 Tax=Ovis ammon polii TaxID=230172 RepID=A0AAD4XYF9_OVIAM|nr:hypothetical protein MG293_018598 [Ovis ammon polii]